jgi:hypothetical protein
VRRFIPPLLPAPESRAPLAPDDVRYQVELVYAALVWASTVAPHDATVYLPRDPSQLVGMTVEIKMAQTLTKRLKGDVGLEPAPVGDLNLACSGQPGAQTCHYQPYQAIIYPEGQRIDAMAGHAHLRISYNATPDQIAAAANPASAAQSRGRNGILETEYCLTLSRTAEVWTVTDVAAATPSSPISQGPCARLGR